MKFGVHIKIGQRQSVLGWNGEELTVGVDAPPVKGAANEKLIDVLCEQFKISKSQIRIISGLTSRHKILEVNITPTAFNKFVLELPQLPHQSSLL